MREVIAKRDKSIFCFFLLGVLITLLINGYNLVKFIIYIRVFGVFCVVCLGLITLISLFCLILLPNEVLVKEDETLIIYQGAFNKKTLAWDSILSAEVVSTQYRGKETKNGSILLKVKTEDGEESISVHQIKDKKTVAETLNNLIIR